MTVRPPEKDFTDANLKVGPPKTWAVGLLAIEHAMPVSYTHLTLPTILRV